MPSPDNTDVFGDLAFVFPVLLHAAVAKVERYSDRFRRSNIADFAARPDASSALLACIATSPVQSQCAYIVSNLSSVDMVAAPFGEVC